MSEIVQRRMESMIEEIQDMLRTKLYTQHETSAILKKRKEFELKVNGPSKHLEDFNNYIMYEKALLKSIRLRRDKNRTGEKKSTIEFRILKRIRSLYEVALQRFSSDFALCLSYFKFCKNASFNSATAMAISIMIKNFSHLPESWKIAATWHSCDRNDFAAAADCLYKGLSFHKDCQELYTDIIKLELQKVSQKKELKEGDSSQQKKEQLCAAKIEQYIKYIFQHINDYSYYIEMLDLLEPYPFTIVSQNMIISNLLEKHTSEVDVWHTIAQRELRGFHYGLDDDDNTKNTSKFNLERCFQKYKEGIETVPKDKKSIMWKLYLDCVMNLHKESDVDSETKNEALISAFRVASKCTTLHEKYYITWLELDEDSSSFILEEGTRVNHQSLALWQLRLKYVISCSLEEEQSQQVDIVFNQGIAALKEKSCSLWLLVIQYHIQASNHDTIKGIFERGVRQPKDISNVLKPKYIEWLATVKDINEVRAVYRSLANEKPYSKDLHDLMIKLESNEPEFNKKMVQSVHELACSQFPNDINVWINYIKFCVKSMDSASVNTKVQEVYRAAINTLPYELHETFSELYTYELGNLKADKIQ